MSEHVHTLLNTDSPKFQGSILRGVLGSMVGMAVCLGSIPLCWLCHLEYVVLLCYLFAGMVIGYFYRLFHGRRSKRAAYATVSICTLLTCVFSLPVLLMAISGHSLFPPTQMTANQWSRLWRGIWKPLLLCSGSGLIGFFLSRGKLLAYVDWQKGPWYIAGWNAGGLTYNLFPEKPAVDSLPSQFTVFSRFALIERLQVQGDTLRWIRLARKDSVFSVQEIAGVVLGPPNGSNVLYDRSYQMLAKFAGSMENANLLLRYLAERNIPIEHILPTVP